MGELSAVALRQLVANLTPSTETDGDWEKEKEMKVHSEGREWPGEQTLARIRGIRDTAQTTTAKAS